MANKDNFDEKTRRHELSAKYIRSVRKKTEEMLAKLTNDEKMFLYPNYSRTNPIEEALREALKKGVKPSEYIENNMGWLFEKVIPESKKEAVLKIADGLRDYQYGTGYSRRSFRSDSYAPYADLLLSYLRDHANSISGTFTHIGIIDAPMAKILRRELPEEMNAFLDENPHVHPYDALDLAYAIDSGDADTKEAVISIITEENGKAVLSYGLIKGIFYSHDAELHELLGKLLLAARLQEGLRQSICENADAGTKEGFLAILKVIDENNLIRFSAVKRAVATWIGLASEDSRDLERISDKCAALIRECVCSEEKRREYLATPDALKIHIALWSYAFHSVESAGRVIEKMIADGTKHQVITAGYFARSTGIGDVKHTLAKKVLRNYPDSMDVAAMWLPCFMPDARYTVYTWRNDGKNPNINKWFESIEEAEEFYALMWTMYAIAPKSKVYTLCPWHDDKIEQSDFAEKICMIAAAFGTDEKRDEAASVICECNSDVRASCMEAVLTKPKTKTQRDAAITMLSDKSEYTRTHAVAIVGGLILSDEEYLRIEELFRYKSSDIRMNAMKLMMRRGDTNLSACVERLLTNPKEDVRLAGLDILTQLSKDALRKYITESFMPKLESMRESEKLGSKEKLILDKLLPEKAEKAAEKEKLFDKSDRYEPEEFDAEYTQRCADAFGAYFPDSEIPAMLKSGISGKKKLFDFGGDCKTARQAEEDLTSLANLVEIHKTLTFYDKQSDSEVMLGSGGHALMWGDGLKLLDGLWQTWRRDNGITNERLFRAFVRYRAYTGVEKGNFSESTKGYVREVFGAGFENCAEILYRVHVGYILGYLVKQLPEDELRAVACAMALWFVRFVPDEGVIIQRAHLLSHSQLFLLYERLACKNDADLPYTFPIVTATFNKCYRVISMQPKTSVFQDERGNTYYMNNAYDGQYLHMVNNPYDSGHRLIDINANIYAAYRGIITRRQLYEVMFGRNHMRESMETVSNIASAFRDGGKNVARGNVWKSRRHDTLVKTFLGKDKDAELTLTEEDTKLLGFATEVYDELIPVIIDSEISRGDSPADYSAGVPGIYRIYGAEFLTKILDAMGKDTIDRNSYSGWGSTFSRKSSLSYLISICIPRDTDSAETLGKALQGKKISEKRLIEAALVSPEWIKIIGEHLGIEAFESVCYYFMAHMNEKFDDKRKAIIARYTPLSEDELNMGAFDVAWFRSAYGAIGEKEFDYIYDAAKYITDGAKHSRARKYADASLGKFAVDATETEISAKRNKDLLMAYPLIPLSGEDDICRRYLYIQKFRKESKQFGSQRIASEGKATEMALKNLATNAGYADVMRLTLRMETKVIDDSRALMETQNVDGVELTLTLDENGKAGISVVKDGKALKSIPAKLKKNETVLALGELKKTLTEQYRRTRVMLEQAMEDGTVFTFGEISSLCAHPVVYPMLGNLVLVSDTEAGFLCEGGLRDAQGEVHMLSEDTEVKIAHPFDLYKREIWRDYQRYLFDNKIIQPFRQVFRELYIKTADEIGRYDSLRYAGHQIQPAKTAATLRSRRWVADVEDGLQKIYYKENIVAEIYAMADWFSPADIEAPTLEWVCFSDRQTGERIKIDDIPDVIFSEVMRDVDLAVSVAHAGGVDPETSHSTVEMRASLVSFILPMFRISNVKIDGKHAIIDGKLASYSVHLGSGVIHQIGGAMIPVLPVHSQHRGKIFLPFVDDDPKTAEIISKILLFADDGKIKDPSILSNIQR